MFAWSHMGRRQYQWTMFTRTHQHPIYYFMWIVFCRLVYSASVANSNVCRQPKCEFTLVISQTRTMTYRDPIKGGAYSVGLEGNRLKIVENSWISRSDPLVGREVNAHDVITADGLGRNIIVINGQFPGPTLEVVEGSQVIVHVVNRLMTSGVTIHWHGLHQHGSPWMDGVPYITQCPIQPRQTFTYRFRANPAGTHWYHSHMSTQRLDGLSGAFVVHRKEPLKQQLWPSHILAVTDWFPYEGHTVEITSPFRKEAEPGSGEDYYLDAPIREYSVDGVESTAVRFFSGLINGRGRHNGLKYPLEHFFVERDKVYRFRTMNTGAEYAFSISIDNHNLRIVALDGHETQPVNVTEVILYPGERVDLEILCDKPLENSQYWIRARSTRIGKGKTKMSLPREDGLVYEALAVLTYTKLTNSSIGPDPTTNKSKCSAPSPCRIFNCPAPYYPSQTHKQCVPLTAANSIDKPIVDSADQDQTDHEELFFNIGFGGGSHIKGYRFFEPLAPLFQPDHGSVSCSHTCKKDSSHRCLCTQTIPLDWNKIYYIIITNYDKNYIGHHPMHIHGHSFELLKVGFPVVNHTSGPMLRPNPDIVCLDDKCTDTKWAMPPGPSLNLKNPPVKDTVLVPGLGYAVLRIRADNPGLWMMHCHSETHHLEGMALLFHEAPGHYPPPPKGFPTCKNFNWSDSEYEGYTQPSNKWKGDAVLPSQEGGGNICNEVYAKILLVLRLVDIIGLLLGRVVIGAMGISAPLLIYRKCSRSQQEEPLVSMPTRPELRRRPERHYPLDED